MEASAEMNHEPEVVKTSRAEEAKSFFRKYFLDGQKHEEGVVAAHDPNANFYQRNRKLIALIAPGIVVHILWWSLAITGNRFGLFTETSGENDAPNWYMSITMVFGSFVAGSTSEGGAAVAFPVMTLALAHTPIVARDFSLMIQSVGMTSASYTILAMRVQVEWNSLRWVTLGGIVGMIFGLEQIAPRLPSSFAKMYFIAIWSSFAVGLYMLNRNWDRTVYDKIQNVEEATLWKAPGKLGNHVFFNWKLMTLFLFGVTGGIFSSVAGSGIDICSFSCLTLLFRICEKVATPTSVVLMAINTVVGFLYREFVMGGVEEEAWRIFFVCIPIVAMGAPMGSYIGSHLHRLTLAAIIYLIDALQFFGALAIIQPWTSKKTSQPLLLSMSSLLIFVGGMLFFAALSRAGLKLAEFDSEEPTTDEESGDAEKPKSADYTEGTAQQSSSVEDEESGDGGQTPKLTAN